MAESLPSNPNLRFLKNRAKEILKEWKNGKSLEQLAALPMRKEASPKPSLQNAQFFLARFYGFPSWMKLVEYVEQIVHKEAPEKVLLRLLKEQDEDGVVLDFLQDNPKLIQTVWTEEKEVPKGSTPLHYAAHYNFLKSTTYLLDAGLPVDLPTQHWYRTPLSWAADFGAAEAVTLLLERGAAIDADIGDGYQVLHALACGGSTCGKKDPGRYVQVGEILLNAGADINSKGNKHGMSPLDTAIQYGNEAIIELFRSAGGGQYTTKNSRYARRGLIQSLANKTFRNWLQNMDTNRLHGYQKKGPSIAMDCAQFGDTHDRELLREFGYRFNRFEMAALGMVSELEDLLNQDRGNYFLSQKGLYGNLLHHALRFSQPQVADRLVRFGFEPKHAAEQYILSAIFSRRGGMLAWCHKNGVDFTAGFPLHHQVKHGRKAGVEELLQYGSDPNAKNREGNTPLHLLARRGSGKDLVEILLRFGASLEVRNREGFTPESLSREMGNQKMAELLVLRPRTLHPQKPI